MTKIERQLLRPFTSGLALNRLLGHSYFLAKGRWSQGAASGYEQYLLFTQGHGMPSVFWQVGSMYMFICGASYAAILLAIFYQPGWLKSLVDQGQTCIILPKGGVHEVK